MSNELQTIVQAIQNIDTPKPKYNKHRKQVPIPPKGDPSDGVSVDLHPGTLNKTIDAEQEWNFNAYKRLAFVVFMQGFNNIIKLLYKWQEHDWLHETYRQIKLKNISIKDAAQTHNIKILEFRNLYYDYEKDWKNDPIEWMMSVEAQPYLDILNIDPELAIESAKIIANGKRSIGISEPDIELLVLPQYNNTTRKQQAMGRFLQTSFASVTKKNADTR